MAYSLPDGPSDEYDVRNAEDRLSAEEVCQHTGEQAAEHCAKRRRGRDKFLFHISAACGEYVVPVKHAF